MDLGKTVCPCTMIQLLGIIPDTVLTEAIYWKTSWPKADYSTATYFSWQASSNTQGNSEFGGGVNIHVLYNSIC